jgi:hypothetical protein
VVRVRYDQDRSGVLVEAANFFILVAPFREWYPFGPRGSEQSCQATRMMWISVEFSILPILQGALIVEVADRNERHQDAEWHTNLQGDGFVNRLWLEMALAAARGYSPNWVAVAEQRNWGKTMTR